MKKLIIVLINLCGFYGIICAQETDFNYQIILETKGEYNNPDKKSVLNPDNRMGFIEVSSVTQLYPILGFRHEQEKFSSLLQVEGNFCNPNFSGDSLSFIFQELYLQFTMNEKHYVSVGKRRLNWGSGMLWNPTNFYIQKDPFRTQNRLEGIFQASYSLLFPNGTLQAYVFPEKKIKDFSYAIKYDYYGNRIDASVSFLQYTRYQQFGYSASYGGNISTLYVEGVFRNYSKSYKVNENGILLSPLSNKKKFWTEVVAGFSVNFNAHLSFRGEYRFREDYLNNKEIKSFKNHLPEHSLIYDPISIGKHTVFGNLEWKNLYDQYFVQVRAFLDPISRQFIVSPLFIWKYKNLQTEVSGMIYNKAIPLFNYQGSVLLSYSF